MIFNGFIERITDIPIITDSDIIDFRIIEKTIFSILIKYTEI